MANNRYRLMQDIGALTRTRQQNLRAHPMSAREAARMICEMHTVASDDGRIRVNFGLAPDFTKVDGDVYHEAWRTLRKAAGLARRDLSSHYRAKRRIIALSDALGRADTFIPTVAAADLGTVRQSDL
jgi:hypothetical protein